MGSDAALTLYESNTLACEREKGCASTTIDTRNIDCRGDRSCSEAIDSNLLADCTGYKRCSSSKSHVAPECSAKGTKAATVSEGGNVVIGPGVSGRLECSGYYVWSAHSMCFLRPLHVLF